MKLETLVKVALPLAAVSLVIYEAFQWYQDIKYFPERYVGKIRSEGL